jgi:hypothetical protein
MGKQIKVCKRGKIRLENTKTRQVTKITTIVLAKVILLLFMARAGLRL